MTDADPENMTEEEILMALAIDSPDSPNVARAAKWALGEIRNLRRRVADLVLTARAESVKDIYL